MSINKPKQNERKTIVVDDVKCDLGWKKCLTVVKGEVYAHTRGYALYKGIRQRLKESYQFSDNYIDVDFKFDSFDSFVDWCHTKYGYMNKELNGRYWAIDKDLKGFGSYSPEGCMFVPNYINSSILDSEKIRGNLPLGVTYRNKNPDMVNELKNCYSSSVKLDGKRVHLGYHPTPNSAHRAWQKAKIDVLKGYTLRDEVLRHGELQQAMRNLISRLESSYQDGEETISLLLRLDTSQHIP